MRILYTVMMFIRVQIIGGAGIYLGMGLTIAARYAVVRRQFSTQEGYKLS